MRAGWCSLLIVAVLPTYAPAGPPIKLPNELRGEVGDFIKIPAETPGSIVKWLCIDSGLSVFPMDLLKDTKTAVVVARREGRYRIIAWTADNTGPSDAAVCLLVIGSPGPDPGPGPKPPDPGPGPVPIPTAGLTVLFVYESADYAKMPLAQQNVLMNFDIRSYLSNKAIKGPDGKTPEYRFYDKDTDVSHDSPAIQEMMKKPRQSVPWLIISNGKEGFEGPLPANVDETMKLLKKYGG